MDSNEHKTRIRFPGPFKAFDFPDHGQISCSAQYQDSGRGRKCQIEAAHAFDNHPRDDRRNDAPKIAEHAVLEPMRDFCDIWLVNERISINPKICHGQACITGTRIPAHQIVRMFAHGDSMEGLLAAYPSITKEDILACLDYAASLAEEQVTPLDQVSVAR
jgi:uncharacterized protein (DUF433 family)